MAKLAFITGITGMVGSHLADYLLKETDWDIVGLIRWRSPLDNIRTLINQINENKRIKLVYGDIRDSTSIDKAIKDSKPDFLFHLAAQSYPLTSFESPLDTLETNIQGTTTVLEALRKYSIDTITHVDPETGIARFSMAEAMKKRLVTNDQLTPCGVRA